jgi:Rrf2 family protein
LRLTRAGEYAVRSVLYLASQGQGVVCNRKKIANAMDIPTQFLAKIAQQLAHAGLIEIVQGSKGGLRLVKSPEKVSLLDVVEAVIGEIFLTMPALPIWFGKKPENSSGKRCETLPSINCCRKTVVTIRLKFRQMDSISDD